LAKDQIENVILGKKTIQVYRQSDLSLNNLLLRRSLVQSVDELHLDGGFVKFVGGICDLSLV